MSEERWPYTVTPPASARRFHLLRHHDITGVSGVGIVAQGVQFADGVCVLRWMGDAASTVVHDSIEDVRAVHGHGGLTSIIFED